MNPIIEIRLLGGFHVSVNGARVALVSPRIQSLLTYLVMHRGVPQPRQKVACTLFPDTSEAQARTNLHKQIRFLRKALAEALPNPEGYLDCDGPFLQWRAGAEIKLDVAEFEKALEAGCLENAVEKYSGNLLPSSTEEWIIIERERLRRLYMEALNQLVRQKEDRRDYPGAVLHAMQLLKSDPLREEIYRCLMRLHALNGDRAAALHLYQNCVTVLERELGAAPSRQTQQVYEQILDQKVFSQNDLPVAGHFPLIGRDLEWSALLRVWETVCTGRPRMAVIHGEAGIGKTRLAEELLVWADRQGYAAASANCYAAEGELPYAPITAWLRERPLNLLSDPWRVEIARLLPEIDEKTPASLKPGPLTERWQRQHFYEAMARAVLDSDQALAQPILLLLEDLQWCDTDTLEWLNYLLRYNPHAKLLVVATKRDEVDPCCPSLTSLLSDLHRRRMLVEIELKPLTPAETTRLGTQVTGIELDIERSASLYWETEGNPLFIIEYIRAGLFESRDEIQANDELLLPAAVQSAMEARLGQVTHLARELIDLAAVIGRQFTYSILSQASGKEEDSLVAALDELWRRRVIREQGRDAYDFSHDKLRQVAYSRLSPMRRRRLHLQVAKALETTNAGLIEPVSGQIGMHYKRAGECQLAADWLLKAADAAMQLGAYGDALENLNQALELTSEQDLKGRYSILLSRQRLYGQLTDRQAQFEDLDVLEALASTLDDGGQEGALRMAQTALERCAYLRETSDQKVANSKT
jgi:DNA-binding SARP family transcriptional activator